MLRGLLVLELAKPTRITSIELELIAKSSTAWPEGIGARRTDITEEHTLFHAETVFFRAGKVPTRRNASIGPGAAYHHQQVEGGYESEDPNTTQTPRNGLRAGYSDPVSLFEALSFNVPQYLIKSFLCPQLPRTLNYHPQLLKQEGAHFFLQNLLIATTRLERQPAFRVLLAPTEPHRNVPRLNRTALMDAVRASSPRAPSREHNVDDEKTRRGRAPEKAPSVPNLIPTIKAHSKERFTLSKIGDILKLDHDHNPGETNCKEFKKGTYTYPISFALPANAPPTLRCNYGTVNWRLRAVVHRPGAFKSKLAAHREVIVIPSPTEDDTEDSENIIVERHWDQQLQYLISVSGRSFYIGGTLPITFTLMPLAKMKVHRISVFIEERIDYYTHMKRIARTDPVTHIDLLSIKEQGKHPGSILPLESDDVDAFKNSPLYALANPDDDLSEMASALMGPGPWIFHQDLQLPLSCNQMRITNKNRRSNMVITHQLKCVMRVERGDDLHLDPKTGKRKLFDIVIQTPVHILSVSLKHAT
ncbi:hypothetical protein C0991_011317 [Blastosporella zonata]|nr:hypothetical protein C0991_011317 [Blastosporella zonata]